MPRFSENDQTKFSLFHIYIDTTNGQVSFEYEKTVKPPKNQKIDQSFAFCLSPFLYILSPLQRCRMDRRVASQRPPIAGLIVVTIAGVVAHAALTDAVVDDVNACLRWYAGLPRR